ncbi:AraC family transcriptional regulator [Nonomuraea jiangxiensis]|uniref:AraC-type DNA-binding protein n=1 Tax=Nonomuraea jiangxiensis TaxID=633440 RepID=A0A1G9A1X8_9ACTN|nr:AraC family transcriptional regulator [Nonomuraea jiangxiensis]SDK21247.1 AraC-type DNA-binding protein [Nonomuraea jiangxiensis]
MRYRRFTPAAPLRDVVEHYWSIVSPPPARPIRAVLVPNGRATVQFCLGPAGVRIDTRGRRARNADVFLPATPEPFVLESEHASHHVGVQLTPWGARELWPASGRDPTQVEELAAILPSRAGLGTDPARELDSWLTALLPEAPRDCELIRRAVHAIDGAPGDVEVGDLPGLAGASASTLYREFARRIGLTPKQYISIMRHRRFTDTLLNSVHGDSAAMLAAAAGYYDQSHASREFVRYAGMTARTFRSAYDGIARLMAMDG